MTSVYLQLCLEGLTWPLLLHGRWQAIQQASNLAKPPPSQRRLLPTQCRFGIKGQQSIDIVSQSEADNNEADDEENRAAENNVNENAGATSGHSSDYYASVQRRLDRLESNMTTTSHAISAQYADSMYKRLMNDPVRLQWRLMAQVLDRLCFCIYFIILVLSYIFFYPKSY